MALKIANRLEEIPRVHQEVREFADRHGLDEATRRKLSIIFDELLSNTISYGYEEGQEGYLELSLSLAQGRLEARVVDDAKPFDPLGASAPDTDLSLEDRPIGGLGLHIVRKLVDRVSHERHGATNIMILELQLSQAEE